MTVRDPSALHWLAIDDSGEIMVPLLRAVAEAGDAMSCARALIVDGWFTDEENAALDTTCRLLDEIHNLGCELEQSV